MRASPEMGNVSRGQYFHGNAGTFLNSEFCSHLGSPTRNTGAGSDRGRTGGDTLQLFPTSTVPHPRAFGLICADTLSSWMPRLSSSTEAVLEGCSGAIFFLGVSLPPHSTRQTCHLGWWGFEVLDRPTLAPSRVLGPGSPPNGSNGRGNAKLLRSLPAHSVSSSASVSEVTIDRFFASRKLTECGRTANNECSLSRSTFASGLIYRG